MLSACTTTKEHSFVFFNVNSCPEYFTIGQSVVSVIPRPVEMHTQLKSREELKKDSHSF